MARAADAVGASPMALYRHFSHRDDLVAAVTDHVLGQVTTDLGPEAPWQERVRAWMTAVHDQAVAHPQLFRAASAADSVAWLPSSTSLAGILEGAGFTEGPALARAVHWVSTITLGQAMIAATLGTRLALPQLYAGLGTVAPDVADRAARLLPHLAEVGTHGFGLVTDWTIAALEVQAVAPQ